MSLPTSRLQASRRQGESVGGAGPEARVQRALEASEIMIREGNLDEARRLLGAVVRVDAGCAEVWLRLAWLAERREERKAFLNNVLALEPDHAKARAELARLVAEGGAATKEPGSGRTRRRGRLWLWGMPVLLVAVALVAFLVWGPVQESMAWLWPTPSPTATPRPTDMPAEVAARFLPKLEAALSGREWELALEIVALMRDVDPSGGDVKNWTLMTHVLYGQALVQEGRADEALAQFDAAVATDPDDAEARQWQEVTQTFLQGLEAMEAGDWDVATQSLALVFESIPDYKDVFTLLVDAFRRQAQEAITSDQWTLAIDSLNRAPDKVLAAPTIVELLLQAYRQRGAIREEKGELEAARADLEAALTLRPDDAELQEQLDGVMYKLFPPKRIEIDISKQRLFAWEGDDKIHSFVVSTGLPGQDTATGHFEVLDKIPMAYSSIWRLKMPNWLGIYYVGNIENGIHALPIRPDGSVMWAGLLGQRASYGCVILDNHAARTLYDWAEIGMPVDIHN